MSVIRFDLLAQLEQAECKLCNEAAQALRQAHKNLAAEVRQAQLDAQAEAKSAYRDGLEDGRKEGREFL